MDHAAFITLQNVCMCVNEVFSFSDVPIGNTANIDGHCALNTSAVCF